jgi:hypothetical protein
MKSGQLPCGRPLGEWTPEGAWGEARRATNTILGDKSPSCQARFVDAKAVLASNWFPYGSGRDPIRELLRSDADEPSSGATRHGVATARTNQWRNRNQARMGGMIRWLGILVLATKSIALHAAAINGMVIDPAGYPVDQTVVWAVAEDCLESHRAISDKQGHYSFEKLPTGAYKLFGTHVGLWQIGERTVRVGNDDANNLDLQLVVSEADTGGSPPSMPLSGIITDASNRPISGARITHSGRERQNEVSSNGDGRFGFCRVSGRRVELRIEHQEFRPRTIKMDLGSGKIIDPSKIALRKR